jgi:hypothetical protein
LDSIAVILDHEQIHPRRVQYTDHHDGQQREAPKHADEDGALPITGYYQGDGGTRYNPFRMVAEEARHHWLIPPLGAG